MQQLEQRSLQLQQVHLLQLLHLNQFSNLEIALSLSMPDHKLYTEL
jgi:hypothetical protein